MKCCVYLRKSRSDIDSELYEEGETLARHEKILLDLAKNQSLSVTQIYKEIGSGETISQRPVMQKLMAEIENGVWSGVLVVEIERLARGNTIDQGTIAQIFKYSNTKIITPTKTYDPNNEFDEEYFEFGLFMSRREYKTINRRLQNGRLSSIREGKYVGSQAPYGYVKKKIENSKGYTLEPHLQEANIVQMIYELYTKGELQADNTYKRLGVSLICRKLNFLDIKPRKANAWVVSSIRDILINPVYKGKVRWNWRPAQKNISNGRNSIKRPRSNSNNCIIVNGLHKPLIDDETWDMTQTFMKHNISAPAPSQYSLKNPLSGLIICGLCGRKMVRRPYAKKGLDDTLMCPVTSCKNVSSKLYLVESNLLEALNIWLKGYELNWEVESKVDTKGNFALQMYKETLKKLDNEIHILEKQTNNLHNLLEQEVYTPDKFLERSKLLYEKISFCKNNKLNIENQLKLKTTDKEGQKNIIPKTKIILEIYTKTDDLQLKNRLLKEVITKAVYTKTVNTRWKNSPDEFHLDLYPRVCKQ